MATSGIDPQTGEPVTVYDLEQPRYFGMPVHRAHEPGYFYTLHRRHADTYDPVKTGPRSSASGMIVCMEHSGTHIDAISHQADGQELFGGIDANAVGGSNGFSRGGVEEIDPIVGRGVLIDIAKYRDVDVLPDFEAISLQEFQACIERQGVEIRAGDTVLVRTGLGAVWRTSKTYLDGAGMHGDVSRWLATKDVHAVGADNMAWDVLGLWDDEAGCHLPGHLVLLARRGIYIIENLNLEELSADKINEFGFVCTALKFEGATGSPVRPIAIVANVSN